jgi:23S rRNA (guanosine2251-2'-O)-methyltransferase
MGKIEADLPSFTNQSGNIGLLVLDRIEDPQNLGQIIRTAECAGIDGIIIPKHDSCGITDTVIQVSQGAFTQVSIYQVNNLHQTVTNLKDEEFWVIAMENSLDAKHWHQVDYKGKVAIIAGSEGHGIKKLVLEKCDFLVTIPMQGKTNSLNVSAAVSAVLFERLRQLSA